MRSLQRAAPALCAALLFACTPTPPADGDGTGPGAERTAEAPRLSEVQLRVSGRNGSDLSFTAAFGDRDGDARSLRVRFLDEAGLPVAVHDLDQDGRAESAEAAVSVTGNLSQPEGLLSGVLPGLRASAPSIARAEFVLVDGTDRSSEPVTATVQAQPVRAMGESCDPQWMLDRCAPTLGCRGTPTKCVEGVAPEISRLAYLTAEEGGARILVEGTEPDDDIRAVRVDFLTAGGLPVALDLDNDGQTESTGMTLSSFLVDREGRFLVRLEAAEGFRTEVAKIAVSPQDSALRWGAVREATLTPPPKRNSGQSCDPWGFDVCATGTVCSPGVPGAKNVCSGLSPLRTKACAAAPLLEPQKGEAVIVGRAEGASLWDPDADCATSQSGRPEGLARLRLTSAANVVITTARPGTTFDTVLSVYPACGTAAALACGDDLPKSSASTVRLESLPKGDYLIVVDSWSAEGGTFELSATVE